MIEELCGGCGEELHETCLHCHNEDCLLHVEEKYCENCGEELCYACDGICHECETEKGKYIEDNYESMPEKDQYIADDEPDPQEASPLEEEQSGDWILEATDGIKVAQPIMVMFAVPSKSLVGATHHCGTCGIIVLKMLLDTSKSLYRVISFTFTYGVVGQGKLVLPTSFRISGLFECNDNLGDFFKNDLMNYIRMELASYMYPVNLDDAEWVIRMFANTNEGFCKFTLNNLPLLPNAKVHLAPLSNYDYDYSSCE